MLSKDVLLKAYRLMCMARAMANTYEANRQICKYVHSTSMGHESIQLATAFNLLPIDFVSPYYRDESMLLGLGFTPYQLMLQLLAKADDPFSGGREYYAHPNYKGDDKPTIIHQSSATGMQAIPTTGIAQGLRYLQKAGLQKHHDKQIVLCSLGDASVTEGEVSEAFQFAALHQLQIIYLVQDNQWGISVSKNEARTSNADEFVKGFTGIETISVDGSDFVKSYECLEKVIGIVREEQRPFLVHAKVPLMNHHTSGVRKEGYRSADDLLLHNEQDPLLKIIQHLKYNGFSEEELNAINADISQSIKEDFKKAVAAAEPDEGTVKQHVFAPTKIIEERGERQPAGNNVVMMVDAAMIAIREIMQAYPEAVLYGQDVGRRLGGVFKEAATLAEQFGDHRVFNTAIQEAYIIGSTAGMSAAGVKPIVEIQFADYIYPGFNQLVVELSKSCYLSNGRFPIQSLIRVPVGAYGGGGPYHSSSIETTLLSIKGIKVVYPCNSADIKGLMKAAFLDPNPVVMLEHKGLYWSKPPGTEAAKTIEPSTDYIIPLGKGSVVLEAGAAMVKNGESCCVITYGMGVYWSLSAARKLSGKVEIIDLRSLYPLDEELVIDTVKKHGKCLIVTEEQQENSFAEALAGRIAKACFKYLDAAVEVIGAMNLPSVPLNRGLEKAMLPNADKVFDKLQQLLLS